jgi:Ca2+-binding RTX toxin-like protein
MTAVTVTGANNQILTVQLNGVTNFTVAQQFASIINQAAGAGTLSAYNVTGSGTTPMVPSGNASEAVILSAMPPSTMPVGYTFVTDVASAPTTITGASDMSGFEGVLSGTAGVTFNAGTTGGIFVAGGGANVFKGAGSAFSIYTGDGNDTITTAAGSDFVDAGTGANVIKLGTGSSYVASTSNDLITGGAGFDTVAASGHGATINGGTGSILINSTGAADLVTLGSGGGSIFGGTNSTYNLVGTSTVIGDDGANTVNAGGSTAYVSSGSGNDLVKGGSGALTFLGGAGNSTVVGGSAPVTLFGANGGSVTFTATTGGNTLTVVDSGKVDASGSTGTGDTLFGGLGANTILGGTGADLFVVRSGASSLTGGANGVNTFDFVASNTGGATDVISDFKSADKISLSGYTADTAADVLKSATVSGGSTTITLSDQTKIVFQNYTNLGSGNFS